MWEIAYVCSLLVFHLLPYFGHIFISSSVCVQQAISQNCSSVENWPLSPGSCHQTVLSSDNSIHSLLPAEPDAWSNDLVISLIISASTSNILFVACLTGKKASCDGLMLICSSHLFWAKYWEKRSILWYYEFCLKQQHWSLLVGITNLCLFTV